MVLGILAMARFTHAQGGDWFDRMAVPIMSGTDFASMRDASLKAAGLYPKTELMVGPWYVLGPYARDGSSSVPLHDIDITTKIKTNAGVGGWTAVKGWGDTSQPLDLAPLVAAKENVSAYLFRNFQAPGQTSVEFAVSADDDFTVWLNGREIFPRAEDGTNAAFGKHRKRVTLRKGENELIIRVGQASGPWRLFFGWEPQLDSRIKAKIVAEALKAFPNSPDSAAGRVELAQLFVELGERDRALEQVHLVLTEPIAPAEAKARAGEILNRFLELSLSTQQTWNLFTPDELASQTLPLELTVINHTATTATGQLAVSVSDIAGRAVGQGRLEATGYRLQDQPIAYNLGPQKTFSRTVGFRPPTTGCYRVVAQTQLGKVPVRKEITVGLIPKAHSGLRPDSFFAATTEEGRGDGGTRGSGEAEIAVTAKLGIKVVRDVFCNYRWVVKKMPASAASTAPLELDFSRLDKAIGERKKVGLSVLPIVADARPLESTLARTMKATGPPFDMERFTSVSVAIVKHFPEIKYWDFWADPEIYGETWAASAANFRFSLKMWAQAVKQVRPDVKVLAGGRPSFFSDIILSDPNVVKVIDGMTNCVRFDSRAANWRSGAVLRSMDFATSTARRQGIGLSFVTDSATERSRGHSGLTPDRLLDAAKTVKFHVLAALCGCFQANVHQNGGWGSDFPVGNVAYAVMAELLEDRPVVADLWPAHPLIWGAIFAHPRWITAEVKALPRSGALSTRWGVAVPKERENDATKVAVVWSETGADPEHVDTSGTLTVQPAGDLRALDMLGRPVGQKNGDALTVPFNQHPVYLLSEQLSVAELHKRMAGGRIEGVTPVVSYLYSLRGPLGARPTSLTARVQNQLNRPLKGTIALAGPKEWKLEPAQRPLELKPAELTEVDFRVTATSSTALNLYPVQTRIESDGGKCERRQIVAVACIRPLTAKVDGNLDEWTTATFARVDSQMRAAPEAYLKWLEDPKQSFPAPPAGVAFVGVKVAAGYDANNLYIAAVVREPGLGNATNGEPTSYDKNPMTNGDCLEFAFGFGARARDDYRTTDNPWYWKGMFRDTDFAMLLSRTVGDAPFLLSLFVPGFTWRTDFQTERANTWPVGGGMARFVRDENAKTTTWEIAVPRKYLNLFDPSKPYCRFGFLYYNDEKLPPLEWAQGAGVFDYWTNYGSFLPAWNALLPCQTRWGIGR